MKVAAIFAAVAWVGVSVFNIRQVVRLWGDPRQVAARIAATAWIPAGPEFRRGVVRGAIPFAVGSLSGAAGIVAILMQGGARSTASGIGKGMIYGAFSLMAIAVVVQFAIVFFNRPISLVPPHMRNEAGMFKTWRQGR
jgi:hypothetical protein